MFVLNKLIPHCVHCVYIFKELWSTFQELLKKALFRVSCCFKSQLVLEKKRNRIYLESLKSLNFKFTGIVTVRKGTWESCCCFKWSKRQIILVESCWWGMQRYFLLEMTLSSMNIVKRCQYPHEVSYMYQL